MSKDRRLGRGLAALLGTPGEGESTAVLAEADEATATAEAATENQLADQTSDTLMLDVYSIDDNPFQPRREFHEPEIASLAESLKQHDMLQPILVRRVEDRFQLISGERRLRAAIQAGWSAVPARIREADDRLVAELTIVENLQRKDLNAIEKALSFKRYLDEHGCKQEELAGRLKLDRSTIANLLRLLELPESVREAVQKGTVSAGHARALLPLGDEPLQTDFCKRLVTEGWSVRETEKQVQEKVRSEDDEQLLRLKGAKKTKRKSQQTSALEQELRVALGAKIDIQQTGRSRGRIVIHFANHDEFERIRSLLSDGQADSDLAAA